MEKNLYIGNVKGISNIKELGKKLEEDKESLTYRWDDKQVKLKTVLLPAEQRKDEENDSTVLWYDEDFVKKFEETDLGVDGTYNARPNMKLGRSSQLLTIMASYKGKVRSRIFMYTLYIHYML